MKKITLFAFSVLVLLATFTHAQSNWKTSTSNGTLNGTSLKQLDAKGFEVSELNFNAFKTALTNAPMRGEAARYSGTVVEIPNEQGNLEAFTILEAPVFSPSLAIKYPNIKSYVGYSTANNGATLRMSVSPKGVQTMVTYLDKPTTFMQPVDGSIEKYVTYTKASKNGLAQDEFICSTVEELKEESNASTARDADDQTLRKFRIAISVNGEYTTYHGSINNALAAINATLTRVNAVFETDMAVTFELVDAVQLIYSNASTDPYSSMSNWNGELQSTLTSVIGEAAYDIGHMFGGSGGGGNAGCIGCVCQDGSKGSGITSPSDGSPEGDTFDIDYVAHEIGHQMGANHTFSHSTEGYQVNAEPGSGSTIMGYAGITSSNVQQHSDAYFHYHSIKQILDNLVGRTCWQDNSPVSLTNNPPVSNAGNDYTIPQGTAYVLRGSATDADSGDTLTYCWEQTDNGQVTSGSFGPTSTVGAMVRSLPPVTVSDRYIPKRSRVIAGQLTQTNPASGSTWETVSTISRDLNFALTVRDRNPTATGLNGQSSFDLMKVTVDATTGPFIVTSQTTNETWNAGSSATVTWDVAGTTGGAVNTATVNILMSVDGGNTFPYTAATNVANNGSATFSVPSTGSGDSSTVRVLVEGNGNIFYAMNSANFSLQQSEYSLDISNPTVSVCAPTDAVYNFTYSTYLGFTGTTTFSAAGLPTGATATFSPTTATADATAVTCTVSGLGAVAQGNYNFTLVGTSGSLTKSSDATLQLQNDTFDTLVLTAPADAATGLGLTPSLAWDADSNAASYDVDVASDSGFTSIISSNNVTTNGHDITSGLIQSTTYYWRVKSKNDCGEGAYSATFSFTTGTASYCESTWTQAPGEWISNTTFNTINNDSGNANGTGGSGTGYEDFTAISTEVQRGQTQTISVSFDTDGYQDHVYVFIDWNQNFVFDNDTERYDLGEHTDDQATATLDITIPADATFGSTRMRVVLEYNDPNNGYGEGACDDDHVSEWGETEDYTVIVDDPTDSVEDFNFSNFSLYPNPTNGAVTINFDVLNTDKVNIQLHDVRGRLIGEKNFFDTANNFSENIEFNNVAPGVYLLQVNNGTKQTTRKLVIN